MKSESQYRIPALTNKQGSCYTSICVFARRRRRTCIRQKGLALAAADRGSSPRANQAQGVRQASNLCPSVSSTRQVCALCGIREKAHILLSPSHTGVHPLSAETVCLLEKAVCKAGHETPDQPSRGCKLGRSRCHRATGTSAQQARSRGSAGDPSDQPISKGLAVSSMKARPPRASVVAGSCPLGGCAIWVGWQSRRCQELLLL